MYYALFVPMCDKKNKILRKVIFMTKAQINKILVENGSYKRLDNPLNYKIKPRKYEDKLIRANNGFYCKIEDYDEIQKYFNRSEEERKEELSKLKSENHKKYWANVDHKEVGKLISKGRDEMSDEDKKRYAEKISNTILNFSDEKREKWVNGISNSRKEYFKNMSDDEHEEYAEIRRKSYRNKNDEEKKYWSDIQIIAWKNKSQEQKDEENRKRSVALFKKMKDKNWREWRNQRRRESNLEKFGVENTFQRREIIDKIKDTKLEEYGTLSLGVHTNYRYKGIKFDSSHELYFYIYHHDILKDNISRGKHFKYFIDGISHIYECDFLLNGENVEIKGNHLINENMELIDFYGDKHVLTEKTKCLRDNNVKIIIDESEEMQEIIKIVEEKFPNLVESCVMRFTKRELEKLNPKPKVKKSKLKNVDEKNNI